MSHTHLAQAIERGPDYALAFCALSEAHLQVVNHDWDWPGAPRTTVARSSPIPTAYEHHWESASWLLAMPGLYGPELAEMPRFRRLVRLMGLDAVS